MKLPLGVLLVFLTIIYARSQEGSLLTRLLSSSSINPVILVVDPKNVLGLTDSSGQEHSSSKETDDQPENEDAYKLYNVLRTQPEDNLDEEVAEKLEETKQVLRQTLRARCAQLDRCVKKCPTKPKRQCKTTCQQKFDNYDACNEEPPKCKKDSCKKRGKTLPPYFG